MGVRRGLTAVTLVAVMLAFPSAAVGQGTPPTMTTTTVNSGAGDQTDPHISGSLVSYLDYNDVPVTYVVNSTGDGPDTNTADGLCQDAAGKCTLRAAIQQANAHAGADTITFNIPGPAVHTIKPGSALPTISDPVTIDGTTEPDYSGKPVIELDGSSAGAGPIFSNGLMISAGNSTVRGLAINRFFGAGIFLLGGSGNVIEGNFIGTDALFVISDRGNAFEGVLIFGSSGNRIGGTAGSTSHPFGMCTGSCNLISGNDKDGIGIVGASTGNKVQGNFIGTSLVGEGDLGNSQDGVFIGGSGSAATGNIIGGTTFAAINVISGNDRNGIRINDAGSTGNVVQGNFIGTKGSGTGDFGNSQAGVLIDGGAAGNTIGGTASGAGNVISGNDLDGVSLSSAGSGNSVLGNRIGTDRGGTFAIGNSFHGVRVVATSGAVVGGTAVSARNVISGNGGDGVRIVTASNTQVLGNYVGTDVTGTLDLGNAGEGVRVNAASGNTIGGTPAGAGNVISGNGENGVLLDAGASGNLVQGNRIGADAAGTAALGNSKNGVKIDAAPNNTVGGTAAGAGNTIAFNGDDGVAVGSGTGNAIRRNAVHSNSGLGIDLGPNGVTPNDPGDGDTGANNLQNFPVLTSAITAAGVTTVQGTLDSTPNTTFTLEFFANGVCDPSGHGEAESFKGSTTVTTDGSGMASFAFVLPTVAPAGQFLTATATDPGNNTSELSKCREVRTAAGAVTDLIGDVQDLKLQQGIENSLLVKLQAALSALAAGDTTTACNNLGAFINEVQAQSGKKIPAQDAADLIKKAEELKKALGCP